MWQRRKLSVNLNSSAERGEKIPQKVRKRIKPSPNSWTPASRSSLKTPNTAQILLLLVTLLLKAQFRKPTQCRWCRWWWTTCTLKTTITTLQRCRRLVTAEPSATSSLEPFSSIFQRCKLTAAPLSWLETSPTNTHKTCCSASSKKTIRRSLTFSIFP